VLITGINHLTWNVSSIDEAFDFYVDVLGFKPVMKYEWSAYFLTGETWIAIVKGEKRSDERYDHIAFQISPGDYALLVSRLTALGVRQWKQNESEGDSFYFLDPSDNKFELHYSDLEARIEHGKANWGPSVRWYL
jgi:catechol 2,3-dioxygenase-like lactoylglutathione lyase family enzyme